MFKLSVILVSVMAAAIAGLQLAVRYRLIEVEAPVPEIRHAAAAQQVGQPDNGVPTVRQRNRAAQQIRPPDSAAQQERQPDSVVPQIRQPGSAAQHVRSDIASQPIHHPGVAAQQIRQPDIVPEQNADWVASLLEAADELGVTYTPECVQVMRDHVAVRGFVRGAVTREGRFLIRDVYGEDRWFCGRDA